MKISELIGTLSEALREVGDAEVCLTVGNSEDALVTSTALGRNIDVPTRGTINIVVIKGTVPDPT